MEGDGLGVLNSITGVVSNDWSCEFSDMVYDDSIVLVMALTAVYPERFCSPVSVNMMVRCERCKRSLAVRSHLKNGLHFCYHHY